MKPNIELFWPVSADRDLRAQIHRILYAVVEQGGAVGYLEPPAPEVTDAWLDGLFDAVQAGDAAMVLALVDGQVEGTGLWLRGPAPIFAHTAEVGKIMAHPSARGLGLGRLVVSALIEHAREAGIETLKLGARGNNHGAIELYQQLGFREWGRLPNVVAIGNMRFDDVKMFMTLNCGPEVILHGSQEGGPGSSPRRVTV